MRNEPDHFPVKSSTGRAEISNRTTMNKPGMRVMRCSCGDSVLRIDREYRLRSGMPIPSATDRMFRLTYPGCLLVLILAIGAGGGGPQALTSRPDDMLVRAAHWFDPASGELRGRVMVHVSGGKIAGLVP